MYEDEHNILNNENSQERKLYLNRQRSKRYRMRQNEKKFQILDKLQNSQNESSEEIKIDLTDTYNNFHISVNSTKSDVVNKKLIVRPASLALKHIGLGLIKMQYFENFEKFPTNETVVDRENGISENGINLWKSAWTDDYINGSTYLFKHMLESRFNKGYKCILFRSRFCRNQAKMSRLNWIHHLRQGHFKINYKWRNILKKSINFNVDKVFEIHCALCNKNKKMILSFSFEFMEHMKKCHPQFYSHNDYSSYFKRCFICNDQTKSFDQNLNHRKLCLAALIKDPNQIGTENFNHCFKVQRMMTTLSLLPFNNGKNDFEVKLKLFSAFKRSSLYFWLQEKKINSLQMQSSKNGINQKSFTLNSSFELLRQNILKNKSIINCTISDRVAPSKEIDFTKLKNVFIPVPFLIKNEAESKRTYVKWRKSVSEENSAIPSVAPWYCEICNAMLKNVKSAYCHVKMCHSSVTFSEAMCKSCNRRFLTTQGYKNHFLGMKKCPVARRCVVCNVSVSVSDIYEHILINHEDEIDSIMKLQTCLICRHEVDNLKGHLFDIHGMCNVIKTQAGVGKLNYKNGSFHNCSKCSLTYFSELELRNHRIMSDHYLECSKCPTLKFFLSWELMQHLFITHKRDESTSNSVCDLCDGEVSEATNYKSVFYTPSEKVKHFLNIHLRPCHVMLKDVSKSYQS